MKYIDEFRNTRLVKKVGDQIKAVMPARNINIMEVCGTHTQSFFRFGLEGLMPRRLKLIAGPGCPVCVSSQEYIDGAIGLAEDRDNLILTFGDMLRIPGTKTTLEKERGRRGNVRVVYSALDAPLVARENPDKKVIFLAVGFETTAPTIALSIIRAKKENLKNLFFYSSLKLIPPAMEHLVKDKRLNISGFLCPGHVSCVTGTKAYAFIPRRYKIGCCIAGFEPLDILQGIHFLLQQIINQEPCVQNQYIRVVRSKGNLKAKKIISRVFQVSDAYWRGLGRIPKSGLRIRGEFSQFDAEKTFNIKRHMSYALSHPRCRCGDILKGLISPRDCPLFSKTCRPERPVGPCMVSREGTCHAYYRYKK